MSLSNNGTQHISYKYRFPAKGEDFSQTLRGILKPGVYSGGELTNVGNEITIAPFKAVINSQNYDESENNKVVILETEANATITASDSSKTYLYVKYNWQNATNWFADFDFRSSSGIAVTNEIILGTCTFVGSGLTGITTENRTLGMFDENYNVNFDKFVTISSGLVENDFTISNNLTVSNGSIYTDDIKESSPNSGVIIDGVHAKDGIIENTPPIGSIITFAGSGIPFGYLDCDGSAISRITYINLFNTIGIIWGVGDGSTTFNLPDLQGAFLRGTGSHGSETMADGNPFEGPSIGSFENDQMQGHRHEFSRTLVTTALSGPEVNEYHNSTDSSDQVLDPETDGINGTPRVGDETRPFAAGIKYIIKY
jgi:microcystin-dependent protein